MYLIISCMCISLLSFSVRPSTSADPIIVRHDVNDTVFQNLAGRFDKYVCHLNLPDCEGTLISDRWVISAAHCALEIQNKLRVGERHFVIINNSEIEVDNVVIHEKFQDDSAYDLALLHLKRKPKHCRTAHLYSDSDEQGQIVYIVGKGDKGDGLKGIDGNDGKLRAATNKVEDATDFWLKWYFDNPEIPNDNLTEYEGISGPGDSGGPAFILRGDVAYIAGVSSGQSAKNSGGVQCVYGVREYYVRVSRYIDWIEHNMRRERSR